MKPKTIGQPAVVRRIARTPEAQVEWALRFRQVDLARRPERERQRAWATLLAWQGGLPGQGPRPADDGVLEAQQALRECIEAFANKLPDTVEVPAAEWALWPSHRPGELITRVQVERAGKRVTRAVVFALVDDLNAIGPHRLRSCPLETEGQRCGVIFLATRRQKFCSRQHAMADAWKRYEPKRKKKREDY
jgi:hypothetical protein